MTSGDLNMPALRDAVCQAVEAEIQSQVGVEEEIVDEDYIEVAHSAWARFYSCAIQYHLAGQKPMGLIVDSQ